jgi:hypothetical protein
MLMRRRALLTGAALTAPLFSRAQPVSIGSPVGSRRLGPGPVPVGGGAPAPSLDLSFMTPGTLPSGLTFTRASTGTYIDSTGTMQTAASGAPRWDYDPVTHVLRGLLIEEARTNLLLNSATLSTQSVTTTNTSTTLSFYGTGTITKSGTATGALVGTGIGQRVSQTFAPTAGTLTLTVTGTVSNAQLEVGAFPTSYIPTTGASATRAVDLCNMPTAAWFNITAGTLDCEGIFNSLVSGGTWSMASLDDGTINTLYGLRTATPNFLNGLSLAAAAVQATVTSAGAITAGAVTKGALAYAASSLALGCNGAAYGPATPTAPLAGLTRLAIGAGRNSAINGCVQRVRYWPSALSAGQLQTVTT